MDDLPTGVKFVADTIHPLARYMDAIADSVEAPEFIIDDLLTVGTSVVAGERGLGKTSALVPLMLAATGLLNDYPLKASIRRRVVYIAEDAAQVRRIISAMRHAGLISAGREELNHWFRLVEAKRLPPQEIVEVVPEYDDLYTPNQKMDGSIYLAPPVVVFDTTNATIDLENISDNAEVSRGVATLRQRFGPISIVLVNVCHVSKASRSDAKQLSFIGAGSWEGDTQQAIYLVSENDERYLILGKKRFEADVTEYRIVSYVSSFDATDMLGRTVEIKCFYGVPEASSKQAKEEAKAERQEEAKAASWAAVQDSVAAYVGRNPGASTREISNSVTGKKAQTTRDALAELVSRGEIRVEDGPHNAKHHYLEIGTQRDTDGDSW